MLWLDLNGCNYLWNDEIWFDSIWFELIWLGEILFDLIWYNTVWSVVMIWCEMRWVVMWFMIIISGLMYVMWCVTSYHFIRPSTAINITPYENILDNVMQYHISLYNIFSFLWCCFYFIGFVLWVWSYFILWITGTVIMTLRIQYWWTFMRKIYHDVLLWNMIWDKMIWCIIKVYMIQLSMTYNMIFFFPISFYSNLFCLFDW